MRPLAPVLVSEGAMDDRFLSRILTRSLEDIALREFEEEFYIADVLPVRAARGPSSVSDSIERLRADAGSFNLVIFHHDAGANPERTRREWLEPMAAAWAGAGMNVPMVFVVPVRESEAWALVDGDALRRVLGVNWSDAELGLPAVAQRVAVLPDPKRTIKSIAERTRRRRVDYARLGDLIDLARLAEVTAFRQWTESVVSTMEKDLGMTRAARKGPR